MGATNIPGLDLDRLPRHVAIIMDGNGRWAQQRGLTRIEGHKRGKDAVRAVVETARRLGIAYLSLFAFSTENWQRPRREVDALMALLHRYLRTELRKMMKNEIRLLLIGDIKRLPPTLQRQLQETIEATQHNRRMSVMLAVSYSGREDLVQAARALARDAQRGHLDPDGVDERVLAGYLNTAGIPDPDLLIRTSGEMRISNFFLWQSVYAEWFFVQKHFPELTPDDLAATLDELAGRQRRFGG